MPCTSPACLNALHLSCQRGFVQGGGGKRGGQWTGAHPAGKRARPAGRAAPAGVTRGLEAVLPLCVIERDEHFLAGGAPAEEALKPSNPRAVRFHDLGGIEAQLRDIRDLIQRVCSLGLAIPGELSENTPRLACSRWPTPRCTRGSGPIPPAVFSCTAPPGSSPPPLPRLAPED